MASLDGTVITLHILQVHIRLQKIRICRFVDNSFHVLLHLIEDVWRKHEVFIFKALLYYLMDIFGQRQFTFLQESINSADNLLHPLAVALLFQAFTCKIETQSVIVNASFLLDISFEQIDAITILQ